MTSPDKSLEREAADPPNVGPIRELAPRPAVEAQEVVMDVFLATVFRTAGNLIAK